VGRRSPRLRNIEFLVDVGLFADEILRPADGFRQLLAEGQDAEAIACVVPDPPTGLAELRERFPELGDGRLRLVDVPDEQAEDQPITAT